MHLAKLPETTESDEAFVRSVCCDFKSFAPAARQIQNCETFLVETSKNKLFFKKSCVSVLQRISPRNSDLKWKITQESFLNEHKFLANSLILTELKNRNVFIPVVYGISQSGKDDDFQTIFRTLLQFLDTGNNMFREERHFNSSDSKRVLFWLARFHATFWGDQIAELHPNIGAWWRNVYRPTVDFNQLLPTILSLEREFPPLSQFLQNNPDFSLRIAGILTECKKRDRFVELLGPKRTLLHGDCKSSNFFIRGHCGGDVFGIDFQWVGSAASGAADVVYFLLGSVENVWELFEELKDEYFQEFHKWKPEANLLTRAEFDQQCDLEILDFFTTVCPYILRDLTEKKMKKNAIKFGYLTFEDDVCALVYLFQNVLNAFQRVESLLF